MALLVVRISEMVTCGYHLLILSVQPRVRPDRKIGEGRAHMKKAGIVARAFLAIAVLGLGIRQWRKR
jgi:hypothetical protein